MGCPAQITAAEIDQVNKHLAVLAAAGMSRRALGQRAGSGALGAMERHIKGRLTGMRRSTYEAVMEVEPRFSAADFPGRNGGPRTDPTATARKLRALAAIGYSVVWMAEEMGTSPSALDLIMLGQVSYVSRKMHAKVSALYRTHSETPPAARNKQHKASITRRKRLAAKNRWAPPVCWDDDTIGDPNAIPQFTGCCGTNTGYWRHYDHHILPVCEACNKAHKEHVSANT